MNFNDYLRQDRLSRNEMDLIMKGLDSLIEYMESLDDDKFRSFEQLYSEVFETREGFANYGMETLMNEFTTIDHLNKCLELS